MLDARSMGKLNQKKPLIFSGFFLAKGTALPVNKTITL
jgi:hypothetical protein